uniref:Uncharacterized protein n=1 Tax=Octopus bimaculoides TaxID=37653 RepID=A0A0L8I3N3_OCTBM
MKSYRNIVCRQSKYFIDISRQQSTKIHSNRNWYFSEFYRLHSTQTKVSFRLFLIYRRPLFSSSTNLLFVLIN